MQNCRAELGYGERVSYLDSVPDINFLTEYPDIEITYNDSMLGQMSFSRKAISEDKYDFISVAMRDLLIGLGMSSSYRYNPVTNGLENPSQEMIPFEKTISKALGNYDDPLERFAMATKGELQLGDKYTNLKLYAPTTWKMESL